MIDLKGKTAFITGGASGIGLGIAKAFAKEGMNIVIADLRQSAIDEAMPYFVDAGVPVLGTRLDVTDRAAYVKAADKAEAKFGKIHVLVSNAGIAGAPGPLWEVSAKDTDFALRVNLTGILNGIQTIVPRIIAHGEGGHVVSTASKAGLIPVPGFGLYNLTKQAVVAIHETLASDLPDNIGSSVLCPGPYTSNLGISSAEVQAELLGEAPPPPPPRAKPSEDQPEPKFDMTTIFRDPVEAGERVVRGIKRNDIYIITHSEFKNGFSERVNAMLRAFPEDAQNEALKEVFGMLVNNPVFGRQEQVPALDK